MFSKIRIWPNKAMKNQACRKFEIRLQACMTHSSLGLWYNPKIEVYKTNRPDHNIHVNWTNFWQPTTHVQQNIFEKVLKFVVHIFTLLLSPFASKLVDHLRHSESLKCTYFFMNIIALFITLLFWHLVSENWSNMYSNVFLEYSFYQINRFLATMGRLKLT